MAKPGRNGVGTIRQLIEERIGCDGVTESHLEDEFRALVATSSIPMPQPQYVLRDARDEFVCRSDFAYPDRRALIELDSEAYHMDPRSFRADRVKQNRAHSLGWTVYRFTWHQVIYEPDTVLRTLALKTQQSPSRRFSTPCSISHYPLRSKGFDGPALRHSSRPLVSFRIL